MSEMVKLSSVVSVYTYSHTTLKLGSSPALFRGFSSVLECKAAIEGLAVDSRCSTYCLCGHNEACTTYQVGTLDAQPS